MLTQTLPAPRTVGLVPTIFPWEIEVNLAAGPEPGPSFRSGLWPVIYETQEYRIFAEVSIALPRNDQIRLVAEAAARQIGAALEIVRGAGSGRLRIRGIVQIHAQLPAGGELGDLWVVLTPLPSHGWMWTGHMFEDIGPFTGVEGPAGPPGPANHLAIGSVVAGLPGGPAAATITGLPPNQILNLTLPRGEEGPAGGGAGTITGITTAAGSGLTGGGTSGVLNLAIAANAHLPGAPTTTTAPAGNRSTLIATTDFVHHALDAHPGGGGDITQVSAIAPLHATTVLGHATIGLTSPLALSHGGTGVIAANVAAVRTHLQAASEAGWTTGAPVAPTAATVTSNTQIATTAFVHAALAAHPGGTITGITTAAGSGLTGGVTTGVANLAIANNAHLPGIPTAATAASGTSTTQIATTAFVLNEVGAAGGGTITGVTAGTGLTGGGTTGNVTLSLQNNVHLPGSPTADTAPNATDSTRLATTAFVHNLVNSVAGSAIDGITTAAGSGLTGGGTSGTLHLAIASNAHLPGAPTADTAAAGTNTTRLATTAFVHTAVQGLGGSDITQISTTAPLTGGGTSGHLTIALTTPLALNHGGTGVNAANVAAVRTHIGAASEAGWTTGAPTAPTASTATSTTQIASTAFVHNALAAHPGGTGTVTSIATTAPIAGGTITGSGTISHANSGVAAGTYQGLQVNVTGHVISATNMNYATQAALSALEARVATLEGGGPTPNAPVFTSTTPVTAEETVAFNYEITATGHPAPTFNATGLPAWLLFTSPNVHGTPPVGSAPGPVTFTAHATNAHGSPTMLVTVNISAAPAGWTVHHSFPAQPTMSNLTGRVALNATNWPGWTAAMNALMTDDLYDAASQAVMPVRLFATFSGQAELEIPFDNWTNPVVGTNALREWGYDSVSHSIYIVGNNATGQPIQLRLVHS